MPRKLCVWERKIIYFMRKVWYVLPTFLENHCKQSWRKDDKDGEQIFVQQSDKDRMTRPASEQESYLICLIFHLSVYFSFCSTVRWRSEYETDISNLLSIFFHFEHRSSHKSLRGIHSNHPVQHFAQQPSTASNSVLTFPNITYRQCLLGIHATV